MKQAILLITLYLFTITVSSAHAAELKLDQLSIDSITMTFDILGIEYTDTVTSSTPMVWTMGQYQGVVANSSTSEFRYLIESTADYGGSPTSGTVDPSAGVIALVLDDLHASLSGMASGEIDLWDASSSFIFRNSFSGADGTFSYGWSDSAIVEVLGVDTSADYSILITGNAAPVPVPAAAWLFASALAFLGWIKRR